MQDPNMTDRNGQPVAVGDIIRIVSLSDEFIKSFPRAERDLIASMVGQFFKIYGCDELGQPWVSREYHDESGLLQSHIIALEPHEIEKI